MMWYEAIIAAHTAVTDAVSYCRRLKSSRYFVWQDEASRSDLAANNSHAEKIVTGSTDLYTTIPFDPWADALENALTAAGIAWERNGTDYEAQTGLYHTEYTWEVSYGYAEISGD